MAGKKKSGGSSSRSRTPGPSSGKGAAPVPPPVTINTPEPKSVSLDAQMLTKSDSSIFNPNIVTSADADDSVFPPVPIFIPDDASSCSEGEEEPVVKALQPHSIAACVSNLAVSASGADQAFLALNVSGYGLQDISILDKYRHLQRLNLSYNSLTDLSALAAVEDLVELDVSHNELTRLLDFDEAKWNLRKANYAHNQIKMIPNLDAYIHLRSLDVSHNKLSEIRGMRRCESLKFLNLSHNQIDLIDELNKLPLHELDLSHNRICCIDKMDRIGRLQRLDLSSNNIFSLFGLENKPLLETLIMDDNSVTSLDEVDFLTHLLSLRRLTLNGNVIREAVDYRRVVVLKLQHLAELDSRPVTTEEKVSAVNLFEPPADVQASLDHITHTVYRFLQPSRVLESTLPSVQMPYPMLVLCGPQSSGKRELAHRLAANFPDYFGFGVSHTTRPKRPDEHDGRDYHFVSMDDFQTLVRQGAFVQTLKKGKHLYGLSIDAIESVAKEGLACVTHMELQGVRAIKTTYFEPRYVLILSKTKREHTLRMYQRDLYTKNEMKQISSKEVPKYVLADQSVGGFFDMVICSDNLDEAYDRLRQLVMDYLGVSELPSPEDVARDGRRVVVSRKSGGRARWSRSGGQPQDGSSAGARRSTASSKTDLMQTPVEEASFQRRQQAAIAAIRGSGSDAFGGFAQHPIFPVPLTAPALLEGSPFAQASSMYKDPAFGGGGGALLCDPPRHDIELGMPPLSKNPPRLSEMSSISGVSFTNMSDFATTTTGGANTNFDLSMDSSTRMKMARQEVRDQPLDLSALKNQVTNRTTPSSTKTPGTPRSAQKHSTTDFLGINARPVLPPISSELR